MARAAQATPKQASPVPNMSSYTFSEMVEIKQTIEVEIQSRHRKEIEALREKVKKVAQTLGVSVAEIVGLKGNGRRMTKHARGKQPTRYRGPEGQEWSGRGPAPLWLKPFLAEGKTKQDFLIK
jgi:DNA-binding protein H-NS